MRSEPEPSDVHRQNFLGTQHSGCGDIDKAVNLTEAPTSWPTPDSKLNLSVHKMEHNNYGVGKKSHKLVLSPMGQNGHCSPSS